MISIIVPIYNVEKYLDNCLDSIAKQTYDNFDCYMVNDGSPDTSQDINDRMMFLHDGFFFKTSKKDEPSGEQFANLLKEIHLQEDTQKLENLRLLYVAITRAKRRFIYFYDEDKNYYLPIIQKIEK